MKNIVVFSGAGVSAESGIKTFRDSDGLWEDYNIMDVATPEAWKRQPKTVLKFYNERRKQVIEAKPNTAHKTIASLDIHFNVHVITQNIDDLHERAGSKKILHLHGELMKSRSSFDESRIYEIKCADILWGEKCELGSQLRPHVVWFGEAVPAMNKAEHLIQVADILIIIGTSFNVYPAAGLVHSARPDIPIYLVDPGDPIIPTNLNITWLKENATTGMNKIKSELLNKYL